MANSVDPDLGLHYLQGLSEYLSETGEYLG